MVAAFSFSPLTDDKNSLQSAIVSSHPVTSPVSSRFHSIHLFFSSRLLPSEDVNSCPSPSSSLPSIIRAVARLKMSLLEDVGKAD